VHSVLALFGSLDKHTDSTQGISLIANFDEEEEGLKTTLVKDELTPL
jgi:hypothetical protein